MELLFIIFILLFLYKIEFKKSDDYLSKDYTNYIRGICAIAVVLYHIKRTTFAPFEIFNYLGNPIVGVFFFLSGYGMFARIKQIGLDNYMSSFVKKRCVPLFKEYAFIWLFNFVLMLIATRNFDFIKEEFTGPHAWYIVIIEFLYLLFFVAYKIFKSNIKAIMIAITLCELVLISVLAYFKVGEYWYVSMLSFNVGMVYNYANVNNKELKHIVLFGGLAALTTVGEYMLKDNLNLSISRAFVYNIAVLSFAIFVLNIGHYVRFYNPVFAFLGKMSLEIYLIHGIYENVFEQVGVINNNNLLYGFVVIALTIITSYLIIKLKTSIHNKKTATS